MREHERRRLWLGAVVFLAAGLVLAGCAAPPEVEVPVTFAPTDTPQVRVVVPTPEPPPPKRLIVCLPDEPQSLYLYAAVGPEADAVLAALYDGPIDTVDYDYRPVILEKLPSLQDGDARLEEVTIRAGDVYLNPETLLPEPLRPGKPYAPPGCRGPDCTLAYAGGEVTTERLVAEFRLLPDIQWSDGKPVTAADSVFSFEIDAHADTPSTKYLVDRTFSYEAVDERTVVWTGIPGFLDPEYMTNFWTPLPRHLLEDIPPADLPGAEAAARSPLGWGAYRLDSWEAGQRMVLTPNPAYFRAVEGLPPAEFLVFRFLGEDPAAAIQQVLTGECDVLVGYTFGPQDLATLQGLAAEGRLQLSADGGPLVTRLEFNLAPPSGPALFADLRTRQALAACVDRARLAEEAGLGLAQVTDTFLPPDHPLYAPPEEGLPAFDPAQAEALLTAAGWLDSDGDPGTPRTARGVPAVPDGTPLSFDLLVPAGGLEEAAGRLAEGLAACGVEARVHAQPAEEVLAPWPEGPVFGRRFQAALWSWPVFLRTPPCEMYLSQEVPSEVHPLGVNAAGYQDPAYDRACRRLLLTPGDSEEHLQAAAEVQAAFAQGLPALPLFAGPRVVVSRPEVCGPQAEAAALSDLWNVEIWDLGEACGEG